MREKIENEFLSIEVSPAGAELQSIFNKKNSKEYLWQANSEFWPRKSPVLFPVVGKLNNNQFKVDGNIISCGAHGFARDSNFNLIEKKQNKLIYSLKYNNQFLKLYPFKFELRISYQLNENKLTVKYEVENMDDKVIYFSIGGHPAFNCPLFEGEYFNDYYLQFEKKENADSILTDAGLLNGKTVEMLKDTNVLELNEELFSIDTIMFEKLTSSNVLLKSKKSDYSLKFDFSQFPYLAIWKKNKAPFLCIEPWQGVGDVKEFNGELKEKLGIVKLEKNKIYSADYSIEIN